MCLIATTLQYVIICLFDSIWSKSMRYQTLGGLAANTYCSLIPFQGSGQVVNREQDEQASRMGMEGETVSVCVCMAKMCGNGTSVEKLSRSELDESHTNREMEGRSGSMRAI